VHAIRYRRERWVTLDGQTIVASLPAGIQVSTITLSDGALVAEFDGLPASASRVL
jgi:hypothetical protein